MEPNYISPFIIVPLFFAVLPISIIGAALLPELLSMASDWLVEKLRGKTRT